MEKLEKGVGNKGSTNVDKAVETLVSKGTVKATESTFKRVLATLRTNYSKLVGDRTININYGNLEITLN